MALMLPHHTHLALHFKAVPPQQPCAKRPHAMHFAMPYFHIALSNPVSRRANMPHLPTHRLHTLLPSIHSVSPILRHACARMSVTLFSLVPCVSLNMSPRLTMSGSRPWSVGISSGGKSVQLSGDAKGVRRRSRASRASGDSVQGETQVSPPPSTLPACTACHACGYRPAT